jgi:biotin operon repressor
MNQGDDTRAQTVLAVLSRGQDRARSYSDIAEGLGWTRRSVELQVRALRLEGWAIASSGRGVWLADPVELDATIASLHRRIITQYVTLRRLRQQRQRMNVEQTTLWAA